LPSLTASKQREFLSKAMQSIQSSVRIFQKQAYPKDFSNCKTVEGDIFLQWATLENPIEAKQSALSAYQEALSVFEENLFQANHDELLSKIHALT